MIVEANEIFQKANKNFEVIQDYLKEYEMETREDLKEKYLIDLKCLIQIQELLIEKHTRLITAEMVEFINSPVFKALEDNSDSNLLNP
jgi:hypothetical protein